MKQNRLLYVIPECYVDTNLIEYLLSAGVNHQHCCSKVVGQLKYLRENGYASERDYLQRVFITEVMPPI